MKIGILTLPLHTNYGGILQAYALQVVLEHMGYNDVVVLDSPNSLKISAWKYPLQLINRYIRKYLFHKPTNIFYERNWNNAYAIISQHTQSFINHNINRFEMTSFSALSKEKFDVLIVGSDQVWRPMYFNSMYHTRIENAYLAFARNWNIKRIAYAASFGTNQWEYSEEQTRQSGLLLQLFDKVSVREQGGVDLCKKYFGVEAVHVLDPTMLLDDNDYINLVEKAKVPKSKGSMFCYILDETLEKTTIINQIAKEKKLVPFQVNSRVEDENISIAERVQPPVEVWLRGFYDAEFVVTDSFHACVFSILFKKPFMVIGNKGRGLARFESLLSMFKLQDRLILSNDKCIDCEDIKWDSIDAILTQKRIESRDFLLKALL